MAFSPDGKWLAAGSWNNQVQVQDVRHLAQEPYKLLDHRGSVFNVQFSPDGQWLATSSNDQTVRLWNPDNFTAAPVILRGHNAGIGWLAFSPDGHLLLSGSGNDARLWLVSEEGLITLACRTAGRNLTQAEWQQIFPSAQPYRQTCPDFPAPQGNNTTNPFVSRQPESSNLLISLIEQIRTLWHW